MRDIEFSPTTVDVEEGETVRFLFHNTGEVAHEAYIGDAAAQEDHADEMGSMGGDGPRWRFRGAHGRARPHR